MREPPRPFAELARDRRLRDGCNRERNGLAAGEAPFRRRFRFFSSSREELRAALVMHVEQRSGDHREGHQHDVKLHGERRQKIAQRSKRIIRDHHGIPPAADSKGDATRPAQKRGYGGIEGMYAGKKAFYPQQTVAPASVAAQNRPPLVCWSDFGVG